MSSYSPTSNQEIYGTFAGPEDLMRNRIKANRDYISGLEKSSQKQALKPIEELSFVRHYEKVMKVFMQRFMPKKEALPRELKGTAFHFFKRFYLVSSVMDFHPKEMMYTCVYLAGKVCEYVIPIDVFVDHIEGKACCACVLKAIILEQESELLFRINFRVQMFTPYKPVDGLIADLRAQIQMRETHIFYAYVCRFISNMWFTDICLLYQPMTIAVAALTHAASCFKLNIDDFVLNSLLKNASEDKLNQFTSTVRKIRSTVMNFKPMATDKEIDEYEKRLAVCRNPKNDPSNLEAQFDVSSQRFITQNEVNMQIEISLRTAAIKHSIGSGQGFVKCSCTTTCKTNRCLCKKKRSVQF